MISVRTARSENMIRAQFFKMGHLTILKYLHVCKIKSKEQTCRVVTANKGSARTIVTDM